MKVTGRMIDIPFVPALADSLENYQGAFQIWAYHFVYARLKQCKWNRSHCSKSLGISIRTLRNHITEMKLCGWDVPDNPIGSWEAARASRNLKKVASINASEFFVQ